MNRDDRRAATAIHLARHMWLSGASSEQRAKIRRDRRKIEEGYSGGLEAYENWYLGLHGEAPTSKDMRRMEKAVRSGVATGIGGVLLGWLLSLFASWLIDRITDHLIQWLMTHEGRQYVAELGAD